MFAGYARHRSVYCNAVRVRGPVDALHSRQVLEAALSDLGPAAPGLPPQAILIVRHVAPAHPLPVHAVARAAKFTNALRAELRAVAARACRPWLDSAGVNPHAVVFGDEAELAACLTSDWLRGAVTSRWWWRVLLGALTAPEWLDRHVHARGDLLPAVVELLASRATAVRWVLQLSDQQASRALAHLVVAHGIDITAATDRSDGPDIGRVAERHGKHTPLEILLSTVPELRGSRLVTAHALLLATALAVRRAGNWARTRAFARALSELRATTEACAPIDTAPSRDPIGGQAQPKQRDDSGDATPALPTGQGDHGARARTFGPLGRSGDSGRLVAPEGCRAVTPSSDPSPASLEYSTDKGQALERARQPNERERPAETERDFSRHKTVDTKFGGVFYLLNVAVALGLYGDFTAPRSSGLAMSPWDWLAFVGRAWFGKEFQQDALGELLADLAGGGRRRRRGLPRAFAAPDDWTPPEDWSALLASAPRRRIAHRLMPRRWSTALLSYMKSRIALAVGLDEPEAALSLVCRSAARVRVSSTAVDVNFALADLPLQIRRAGLDRDPGWIPAAGRSVRFHFE